MSIKVDKHQCRGCGQCMAVCPGFLLSSDEQGKAQMDRPQDCWGCAACLKECRFGAIRYHLGADIGGKGTTLHTKQAGEHLHWVFEQPTGEQRTITINRREANKY